VQEGFGVNEYLVKVKAGRGCYQSDSAWNRPGIAPNGAKVGFKVPAAHN